MQTFIDQIPDPYDRRYVTLKTMGGAANGAAVILDISTATRLANELLEIGTSTGNRRATALGHLSFMVASFLVGDTDEAVLSAERAVAVGADPVYAATADVWAIGIAAFIGDIETADNWIDKVDNERKIAFFFFGRIVDVFRAQVEVLRGDLSRGDKRLQHLRSDLDAAGDRWMVNNIDAFYAAMPARIASGEAEAPTTQALRATPASPDATECGPHTRAVTGSPASSRQPSIHSLHHSSSSSSQNSNTHKAEPPKPTPTRNESEKSSPTTPTPPSTAKQQN